MQHSFVAQPVAFVITNAFREILEQAIIGFENKWQQCYGSLPDLDVFDAPGVGEIPWYCQKLAHTRVYDVIIALGLVENDVVYRNTHIVSVVHNGIMRVSLDTGVPILNYVKQPSNLIEKEAFIEYFQQQYHDIGNNAVLACKMLFENMSQIEDENENI